MNVIVLAPSAEAGQTWQYAVENLGAEWRCSPAVGAGECAALMEAGAEVLLLLPCRESEALLRAVTESPPLAPPFILGRDAPDGPLPAPEELPGLLGRWRQDLRLPALADSHLPAAAEMAAAFLRAMAVPQRLRAWRFLPDMCALTVVHPPLLADLQHGMYPLVARRYGMTAAGVERSLRLCVESTWTHGSLTALERFFGSSVDPERGKPTNREFLCRVAERLTFSMKRLVQPLR